MKPVFAVQTDFIDRWCLLIPGNLLKAKDGPKIPAYMARPPIFKGLLPLCRAKNTLVRILEQSFMSYWLLTRESIPIVIGPPPNLW